MAKTKTTTPTTTRSLQKALHRFKILGLIRTKELISRKDLAFETGLSQASVTGITADLVKEGLIEEKESGAYKGGRRPTLLAIRPDGVHVLGINMSVTQIRLVIVNFQVEVRATHIVDLAKSYYSPEEIIELITRAIQACMWEANLSREQISGVGVGIPAPVDAATGIIYFLPNYGWEDIPFREMLQKKINHPVFIDNSSNNLAIGEYWNGSGKGVDNFLVITLENGVGAGMVINGQLVRGHLGIAGEFGHICAELDGPPCRCGRNGCVEVFLGNIYILRQARELVKLGNWSAPLPESSNIDFSEMLEELKRGNEELEAMYSKAGRVLGVGIYNMIAMLDPDLVIITGKGVAAGDKLFDPMFEQVERLKTGKFGSTDTEIIIQSWSDGDWARGAGTLVLRELYKSPFFK